MLATGRPMAQALRVLSISHWSQNGKVNAQNIRGEHSSVVEYESQDNLLLEIVDRFSFRGNTIINLTGDTTNG